MNLKVLEEIGLTKGEISVYFTLLKLGSSKTGPISAMAKVSSSKVYKILDRLEKKGLVGHTIKGKIKYFSAMKPKRILDYLDEEQVKFNENKIEIEKLLPQLEKQQESGQKSEAAIYDGFKGVTNFIRGILEELKSGETYYVIGAGYGEDAIQSRHFFHMHHKRRIEMGIRVKMLANFDTKNRLVETTQKNSEIRFLPQYLITNMTIYFYKNKVFIAIFTKEPKGFLLENEEAVKSFQSYFDALWKIAK
jgi:sugar-specific transcriptional regulator TrmB